MKTILKISILPALLLALAPMAFADSVTLNSGSGSSASDSNGNLEFLGTSVMVANEQGQNPAAGLSGATGVTTPGASTNTYDLAGAGWLAAIPGTSWVANAATAGVGCVSGSTCDPNAFYYYETTFTAAGGAGVYAGSINVMADDTAEVLLNGVVIVPFGAIGADAYCSDQAPSCGTNDNVALTGISLLSGTNTLVVIDAQTSGNGEGIDFSANLSTVPEPSSLLLLGSGLLGLAFVAFRKAKPARPVLHMNI
jgi:hypothetical protein